MTLPPCTCGGQAEMRGKLIAKLEAATGADYDLDEEIMLCAYPDLKLERHMEGWYTPDGTHVRVEDYTASIDAALTLVPGNARHTIITRLKGGRGTAHIVIAVSDGRYEGGERLIRCPPAPDQHATPAIALCIAALKAREKE